MAMLTTLSTVLGYMGRGLVAQARSSAGLLIDGPRITTWPRRRRVVLAGLTDMLTAGGRCLTGSTRHKETLG
jgi:hypothetical protein